MFPVIQLSSIAITLVKGTKAYPDISPFFPYIFLPFIYQNFIWETPIVTKLLSEVHANPVTILLSTFALPKIIYYFQSYTHNELSSSYPVDNKYFPVGENAKLFIAR